MSVSEARRGPLLAIETSCDETSAAVLDGDGRLVSHLIYSQIREHAAYGGVVPELASRRHLEVLPELVDKVLADAAAIGVVPGAMAVTRGPGLVGSLLIGVQYAQAWAGGRRVPLFGIHHIVGHLHAVLLENPSWAYPYLALVVSGGHTELVQVEGPNQFEILARTIDDAAGEAFDKAAKLLGLGYPGGPAVARAARSADRERIRLVSGVMRHSADFSFSGLKTALRYRITNHPLNQGAAALDQGAAPPSAPREVAVLAASFEDAVVEALAEKTQRALDAHRPARFLLTGGVAANECLRARLKKLCESRGVLFAVPRSEYCTDNAAMIAVAARAGAGTVLSHTDSANPSLPL